MFEYVNGNMKMYHNINMNNNQLKNLSAATDLNDAVNKIQLHSIISFMKNYTYKKIFDEYFYDLNEPNNFHISTTNYGVRIIGVFPALFVNRNSDSSNDQGLLLSHYNTNMGLLISIFNFQHDKSIIPDGLTFFMSFYHSSTMSFDFNMYPVRFGTPRTVFSIIGNTMFFYDIGVKPLRTVKFPPRFANKKVFIWICCNFATNLFKMAISNYSSYINVTYTYVYNSKSKFFINFGNNENNKSIYVNKLGYVFKFYDIHSTEHYLIMLAEKKNGAYLDNF